MPAITPSLSYASPGVVSVDGRPVARIRLGAPSARVELAMLDGARYVDITPQPRTLPTLLRRVAVGHREDPNRWCEAVARCVFDDSIAAGIDDLPAGDRDDLDALLASLSFPLGRRARHHGAGPLPFVPRWALPAMTASSPTAAAGAMFGAAATRATSRELVAGMRPGPDCPAAAPPNLGPLGLAWSLRCQTSSEQLANVLGGTRWRPPQHWPTDEELHALRRLWTAIDPDTATALALDATRHELGPARLRRALAMVEPLARVCEIRVSRTLAGLEEQVAQAAPPPPARPAPRRPVRRPDPLPAVPRLAPQIGESQLGAGPRFDYPPAVEIADGYSLGEYRMVLPRTRGQLTAWGRRLANCLAGYGDAVAAGRSTVIGIERRGELVSALELDTDRARVRQFVGPRNTRPGRSQRALVERMLADLGLAGR